MASPPLLPGDPPRRIAVYGCCCGMARCGCVAPLISQRGPEGTASADRAGQLDVWLTDIPHREQARVRLSAEEGTPAERARLMADVLLRTRPEQWPVARRRSLIPVEPENPVS